MRKPLIHVLVAAAVGIGLQGQASAQGVPTISPAELSQLMAMTDQLAAQLTQMKAQYAALSTNRGYGLILNDPKLRNYLPDEWANIYDQVASGKLPSLSAAANSIIETEQLPSGATGSGRYGQVLAANKAIALQSYDAAINRLNNIQALMAKTNETGDAKAAADLANRLAAEQATIQGEQTRLALAARLQDAELKLAEEQRSREFRNRVLTN